MENLALYGLIAWVLAKFPGLFVMVLGTLLLGVLMWKHFDGSPWRLSPRRVLDSTIVLVSVSMILFGLYVVVKKDEFQLREPVQMSTWDCLFGR